MFQSLDKGDILFDVGATQGVWQIQCGLIALEVASHELRSAATLTQLALAGDVLGVSSLCGEVSLFQAVALMPCQLKVLNPVGTVAEFTLIGQGYLQQQRRLHDMARLRTGAVRARMAHLLEMMSRDLPAGITGLTRQQLPTMREMAHIIDAAHETVCRELNYFLPTRKKEQQLAGLTPAVCLSI